MFGHQHGGHTVGSDICGAERVAATARGSSVKSASESVFWYVFHRDGDPNGSRGGCHTE